MAELDIFERAWLRNYSNDIVHREPPKAGSMSPPILSWHDACKRVERRPHEVMKRIESRMMQKDWGHSGFFVRCYAWQDGEIKALMSDFTWQEAKFSQFAKQAWWMILLRDDFKLKASEAS